MRVLGPHVRLPSLVRAEVVVHRQASVHPQLRTLPVLQLERVRVRLFNEQVAGYSRRPPVLVGPPVVEREGGRDVTAHELHLGPDAERPGLVDLRHPRHQVRGLTVQVRDGVEPAVVLPQRQLQARDAPAQVGGIEVAQISLTLRPARQREEGERDVDDHRPSPHRACVQK